MVHTKSGDPLFFIGSREDLRQFHACTERAAILLSLLISKVSYLRETMGHAELAEADAYADRVEAWQRIYTMPHTEDAT
jgi:hypothetical protein